MFNAFGDGLKNYYTYLYHVLYGSGTHFTGMNYPYGEHVLFTDNMPLFSYLIQKLHHYFHFNIPQLIQIFNFFIVASFFLACVYMYKILDYFKVHPLLLIIFPVTIIIISAPMNRIFAHYGLGIVCYFPMILHFAIQYLFANKRKYLIYFFLLGLIFSFIHLYFLAYTIIFSGFLLLAVIIQSLVLKNKLLIKKSILLTASAVLNFAFVKIFLLLTDKIKDRPKLPWGLDAFNIKFTNILCDDVSIIGKMIRRNTHTKLSDLSGIEYNYYLGACIILCTIIMVIIGIIKIIQKKPIANSNGFILFLTAIFLFAFAAWGPAIINLKGLSNYVESLKQFRAFGRFCILSYFLLAILSVRLIDHFIKLKITIKSKSFTYVVVGFICALHIMDATNYFTFHQRTIIDCTNHYSEHLLPVLNNKPTFIENKFNKQHYQAIIALPYFEIGTEKIYVNPQGDNLENALRFSLVTELPLMNTFMSRTSWGQVFHKLDFLRNPYFINNDSNFKINQTPFLIILDTSKLNLLSYKEQNMVASSKPITYVGHYHYLSFLLADFKFTDSTFNTVKNYYQKTFTSVYKLPVFGNNIVDIRNIKNNLIYDSTVNYLNANQKIDISLWAYINNETYENPDYDIVFLNSDNKVLHQDNYLISHTSQVINKWFRFNLEIKIPEKAVRLKIIVNNPTEKSCEAISNLVIKNIDNTEFTQQLNNGLMLKNNFIISAKK